ncbi:MULTISPECIES: protein kinase domain-containing protein [Streptacidiphilus]|uniref:non-specific serine/threonine protein kinase n=1 Tax=Streptacidiphilus cavernicola TaxID=3342716 RepID=A0ABV6URW0_9ACTN|nr:protein kinase [Streptacidiphilus jeojiense]
MTGNRGSRLDLAGSGAEPLETDDPAAVGTIPLLGRLGSGGMGRVYLGVVDGRYAAVKQVLPHLAEDENFRRHFGHELDNLARLPAAASAPLLAGDREARPPWFATAYIPGITLTQALALNGGALPIDALWLLLRGAAAGLRMVHALDMVHRDLKPSNVMLTPDGVSLIDFGIARAADQSRLTQSGVAVGTPAYMSPEQANATGKLTGATDVFALGSLIAYAATGRPPFGDGSGVGLLYQIVHGEPDLAAVHAVDPELAETVAACLDKNPQARPTAERLHRLADGKVASPAPGWPQPVVELLAQRAAFAATPPDRHVLPVPSPTLPNSGSNSGSNAGPGAAPEEQPTSVRRRRRSRRLLLFVLPVVVAAAAVLTVELLPQVTQAQTAGGAPTASGPGSSSSAPATVGSTASASAGGSASSTASAAAGASSSAAPTSSGSSTGGGTAGSGGSSGSGSKGSTKAATQPASVTATTAKATAATTTAAASPTKTMGAECVLTPGATTCSSNNPTVQVQAQEPGGCTYTATITWGDGSTTSSDFPGSSAPITIATHRYSAKGTYSLNAEAVTDSGFCLANGGSGTFTLTS